MHHTIFLFGEAEKGDFCTPLLCKSLPHLSDTYGNPPNESQGILYAVQALLYKRELIYFRVKEEGFSIQDYKQGLKILHDKELFPTLSAICMPGVGDSGIIEATNSVCTIHKSFLIISQKDLYDFLTTTHVK